MAFLAIVLGAAWRQVVRNCWATILLGYQVIKSYVLKLFTADVASIVPGFNDLFSKPLLCCLTCN